LPSGFATLLREILGDSQNIGIYIKGRPHEFSVPHQTSDA